MAPGVNVETLFAEILQRLPQPAAAVPPSPESSKTNTTLLLEVLQRLSVLETQNGTIIKEQALATAGFGKINDELDQVQINVAGLQRIAEENGPKFETLWDAYNSGKGRTSIFTIIWSAVVSICAGSFGAWIATRGLK